MKSGAAKSALSTTISTAVKASRNEFTEVYALGSIREHSRRGYGKARDYSVQSARKFGHGNAKILPGLRIFNGSSAFFMAIITSTPAPCSWVR